MKHAWLLVLFLASCARTPAPTSPATPAPVLAASSLQDACPNQYVALYEAYHVPSLPFRIVDAFPAAVYDSLRVYRTPAEWQRDANPERPGNPVDFDHETLILVAQQSGSNWSKTEVTAVEDRGEGLLLRVVRWDPTPASLAGGTSFEGYFMEAIAIPKTSKPVILAPILAGYQEQRAQLLAPPTPLPYSTPLYTPTPTLPPQPLPGPLRPSPLPS